VNTRASADFRVDLLRLADDVAVVAAAGELDIHTSAGATHALVGTIEELLSVCPAGSVRRVVEITGLNRALTISATREQALGAGVDVDVGAR